MLAPFFGSSNIVWANVIGLTLIYLSLGYWLGGRAGRPLPGRASPRAVGLAAAVGIAALPFATRPVFESPLEASRTSRQALSSARSWARCYVRGADHRARRRRALGDPAGHPRRRACGHGRRPALRALHGRLDHGHVPARAGPDPAIGTRRTMLCFAVPLALASALLLGAATCWRPRPWRAAARPGGAIKPARRRCSSRASRRTSSCRSCERAGGDAVLHLNEGWALHSVCRPRPC